MNLKNLAICVMTFALAATVVDGQTDNTDALIEKYIELEALTTAQTQVWCDDTIKDIKKKIAAESLKEKPDRAAIAVLESLAAALDETRQHIKNGKRIRPFLNWKSATAGDIGTLIPPPHLAAAITQEIVFEVTSIINEREVIVSVFSIDGRERRVQRQLWMSGIDANSFKTGQIVRPQLTYICTGEKDFINGLGYTNRALAIAPINIEAKKAEYMLRMKQ